MIVQMSQLMGQVKKIQLLKKVVNYQVNLNLKL